MATDPTSFALATNDINNYRKIFLENDSFFKAIVESITDAIYVKDKNGRYIFINNTGAALIGKKTKDFLGKTAYDIFPEQVARIIEQSDEQVLHEGEKVTYEEEFLVDGEKHVYLSTKTPCFDPNGSSIGLIGISKNITERKEREKRKDDFFSIASHELKTPVTTIKAFTQLLQQKFKEQKDISTTLYLSRINHQINNLTAFIEDLLDVSRIQQGRLEFKKEYFSFDTLVNATVEDLQLVTPSHAILIKGKLQTKIYADRKRIAQVLINLISNAVKFSPRKHHVFVLLSETKGTVTVRVKDFGMGISKNDEQRIFDKFYRVDRNMGDTYPGLGVGLYISSEIIRRHNGRLWVESQRGKGSMFAFTLPIRYSTTNLDL